MSRTHSQNKITRTRFSSLFVLLTTENIRGRRRKRRIFVPLIQPNFLKHKNIYCKYLLNILWIESNIKETKNKYKKIDRHIHFSITVHAVLYEFGCWRHERWLGSEGSLGTKKRQSQRSGFLLSIFFFLVSHVKITSAKGRKYPDGVCEILSRLLPSMVSSASGRSSDKRERGDSSGRVSNKLVIMGKKTTRNVKNKLENN